MALSGEDGAAKKTDTLRGCKLTALAADGVANRPDALQMRNDCRLQRLQAGRFS